MPSPYLLLNRSLRIRAANAAYLFATGREASELLGVPLFEAFPDNPADPEADGVSNLSASIERVLCHGRTDEMLFQRYDVASGLRPNVFEYRVWSPANIPVHDEDGNVVGVLHHVEDVTDLVRPPSSGGADGGDIARGQAGQAVRAAGAAARRYRHAHTALGNENLLLRRALSISASARMPDSEAALRRAWWWHRIARDAGPRGWARESVTAIVDELPVDAAAITLRAGDAQQAGQEVLAATDQWAVLIEELMFTVGDGPSSEATSTRLPVLVEDVGTVEATWPGFAAAARSAGLAGAFIFPLVVGLSPIGTLALYRKGSGRMTGAQLLDAALVADMIASAVLTDLCVGGTAGERDDAGLGSGHFDHVHTAVGVLSARYGITPDEALIRLRARAFASDRSIVAVARSILTGFQDAE